MSDSTPQSVPFVLEPSTWGETDVGQRRERNEDAFFADDALQLYVVCDGMGGHKGGGMASKIAVATISSIVRELLEDPDATVDSSAPQLTDAGEILRYAVQSASRAVFERSETEPELKGMGTTAVALWVRDGRAYVANVGDSRVYLVRAGEIKQITTDHSLVNEQIRAGILTEADAKTHKLKNVITRSVGFQPIVEVDIETRAVKREDVFVLCSDGLTNMVDDGAIAKTVSTQGPAESCRALVAAANEAGGDDNITVVVSHFVSSNGDDPDATEDWDEPTVQL